MEAGEPRREINNFLASDGRKLYIDGLCAKGLPPSRQMICNFASRREAGKKENAPIQPSNALDILSLCIRK
jgi:hypothetical protein